MRHQGMEDLGASVFSAHPFDEACRCRNGAPGCAARNAAATTPILSCADIRGPQECASDKHLDPSRRNSAVDYLRPQVVRRELRVYRGAMMPRRRADRSTSVRLDRVRGPGGKERVIRTIDAESPTFGRDLEKVSGRMSGGQEQKTSGCLAARNKAAARVSPWFWGS